MIQKLSTITSRNTVPYGNIALEAYLLTHVEPGECILYLWQNRQTVVIGKNQNSWKECKMKELEADGGYLARRPSGGGAVFHDLGNLNFTFLVRREDYSVERQTEVILQAARLYGIHAERTGRNDIVVEGKKFSGNAFHETKEFCCHHGTVLIDVDKEAMSRYLNASKEKLQSKGVDSVKSRVANLTEYAPDMTVAGMRERLILAFARVYGGSVKELEAGRLDREQITGLEQHFASWEWRYGRKIPFNCRKNKRFAWGEAELLSEVEEGRIKEVSFYSDALDVELVERIRQVLPGLAYRGEVLAAALEEVAVESELQRQMKQDISALLCEEI